MFNPSREEVRDFLFESWRKYRAAGPLTAMEARAAQVIAAHPEYHGMLDDRDRFAERFRGRDYPPEFGQVNPFLHLSMHIAIREQVAIDQPRGVARHHEALSRQHGSAEAAEHEMMDCLGEMLWQAERAQTAPNAAIYLACLGRKSAMEPPGDA
ncbi:MAG TPA: DUF1841 family protein [Usitatibacteraceae bacterium]|nr:DUF1841 family protein [Usitatibacteraceae bacterium]